MTKISLSVEGWPPKKNTAKSLFAEGHPDSLCVLNLLRKVKQALGDSEWNPTGRRQIGLELVMAETPDGFPGDATNYLGGIADVLQANRTNADLSHLGDLAQASLYYDDRQIREVLYCIERGDVPGYRLRVWVL